MVWLILNKFTKKLRRWTPPCEYFFTFWLVSFLSLGHLCKQFGVTTQKITGSIVNSRFVAEVIHSCKLSVRHVGAHLRCEISCKYIAISTVPSFKYFVSWTFLVKKTQNHKRIFFIGYLLVADERSSYRHLDCRRKWYTNIRQAKGTNIVWKTYEKFLNLNAPIPTHYLIEKLGLILKENSF